MVFTPGFGTRIDEQGGQQEGKVCRSCQGIDGLELVCHMFPSLRVGPVGVRVEMNVPEVDTASFGDRPTHPSERTGSAVAGPLYQALGRPVMGFTGTLRSTGWPPAFQVRPW